MPTSAQRILKQKAIAIYWGTHCTYQITNNAIMQIFIHTIKKSVVITSLN